MPSSLETPKTEGHAQMELWAKQEDARLLRELKEKLPKEDTEVRADAKKS